MITEVDLSGTPCFATNTRLSDLKAVNFIFGPNGSGKTTLTRTLSDKNRNGNSSAHIYNHDYIRDVFFTDSTGTAGEIPGITFTLGTKDATKQKALQSLQNELATLTKKLEGSPGSIGQREQLKNAEDRIKQLTKDLRRELKSIWSQHSASDTLLQGHKQDPIKLASKLLTHKGKEQEILTLAELNQRYESLTNADIEPISSQTQINLPSSEWFDNLINQLQEPIEVTSKSSLFPLAKELNLLSWISEGYNKTSSHSTPSSKCPYCQQHMSEELIQQIQLLFETPGQQQLNNLSNALTQIRDIESSLHRFVATMQDSQLSAEDSVARSLSTIAAFTLALHKVAEMIEHKLSNPTEPQQTSTISPSLVSIDDHITFLTQRINEHNTGIANRNQTRYNYGQRFYVRLYQDCATIIEHKYLNELVPKQKMTKGIKADIQKKITEIERLKTKIATLREELSDTTEVRKSINQTLEHLGFVRFRLGQSPTNRKLFTIERPSKANPSEYFPDKFETLSEGEKTILSFLYFMHCVKPHSNELGNAQSVTLVIDDPIASTDASTFYFVTALMRRAIRRILAPRDPELQNELSEQVDQVIILTHNVGFYSNSSYEIRRQLKNDGIFSKVAFFKIEKSFNAEEPHKIYALTDPNSISTEYQLLWNEVFAAYQTCKDKPKDAVIPEFKLLSNTLRRILDSYFITLGSTNCFNTQHSAKSSITRLGQSYGQIVEECMIRLNEGSHGSYENYTSSTLPTRQLLLQFERIFSELIDNGAHHGHFLMMMGLPSGGQISDLWEDEQEGNKAPVDSSELAH